MPAGQGSDPEAREAERLATAVDQGRSPESVDDPALAHDLRVVELMRVFGPDPALAPAPDARARARARLRAAMAEQSAPPAPAGSTAPIAPAPLAPPLLGGDTATSVTAEFERIVADDAGQVPSGPATRTIERDAPGATAPDVGAPRSRRGRHGAPSRPDGRSGSSDRPPRRGLRRRVAAVAVASLVALVAVAVGGDLASRGALPGDALYALKRVSENVGVALTFDEQARALRHLDLATTRVDEVERLVAREGAGGVDAAVVEDVIADFDTATGEGTRALLAAQDAPGPAVLGDLQAWASDQAARLSVLRSALPEPALGELDGSLALLDRLVGRTEALEARSDCAEVTSSVVDDLGPLAAEGSCTPGPAGGADTTEAPDVAPSRSTAAARPAPRRPARPPGAVPPARPPGGRPPGRRTGGCCPGSGPTARCPTPTSPRAPPRTTAATCPCRCRWCPRSSCRRCSPASRACRSAERRATRPEPRNRGAGRVTLFRTSRPIRRPEARTVPRPGDTTPARPDVSTALDPAVRAGEASAAAAAAAGPDAPPDVPLTDLTAAAFFDVDNTMMVGASLFHFARGLAARKFLTTSPWPGSPGSR
jgi:hypothetical protein